MASPARFELATPGLGNRCSIQLSYEDERAQSSDDRARRHLARGGRAASGTTTSTSVVGAASMTPVGAASGTASSGNPAFGARPRYAQIACEASSASCSLVNETP